MPSEKEQKIAEELLKILQEGEKLKESSDIQCATTEFLKKEAEKLEAKSKDDSLSFEEKELLAKQITAMQGRLQSEVKTIESGMPKLEALQNKINQLIEEAKKL